MTAADALQLARDSGRRWWEDACYRLAASLAYYALFSIFPLVLLCLTAFGFLLGADASMRHRLVDSVAGATTDESRALLDQALVGLEEHHAARGIGAGVGMVTLLLGASSVFSELRASLNDIWRVPASSTRGVVPAVLSALWGKVVSLAVVLGAAAALLASLAVSTALGAVGTGSALWQWVDGLVSVLLFGALLAAVYRNVPETPIAWGDVWAAGLLTSLCFGATKTLFAFYLAHVGSYAAYGAIGGVLGLLTWLYVANLLFFYGAEFSRAYAERFGSRRKPETRAHSGPPRQEALP